MDILASHQQTIKEEQIKCKISRRKEIKRIEQNKWNIKQNNKCKNQYNKS